MTSQIPDSNGCGLCGANRYEHGSRAVDINGGFHPWTPPTKEQIAARFWARRAAQTP